MIYFLFFCSGLSGLIYQVVWVRVFGNVFGNTIYSASLVIAVFMLGLGVGSYLVGEWADRRYAERPESLLRSYGHLEIVIGLMGLGISALLPLLGPLSALLSSYSRDQSGWYVVSPAAHLAHTVVSAILLVPITVLMGGTLTLLIRHLVRRDLFVGGWRIALLYGINTAGAAAGAFLTDFTLVPAVGLQQTQLVAVLLNVGAGFGALWLARRFDRRQRRHAQGEAQKRGTRGSKTVDLSSTPWVPDETARPSPAALLFVSVALAMVGFSAMGMEILWFRHVTILLGGFRAVFSLLLTVILLGLGIGSLVGGFLHRRTRRPAEWLMAAQSLFVVFVLLGLARADSAPIASAATVDPLIRGVSGFAGAASSAESAVSRALAEIWFNVRPILLEVSVPALLMGFSFPLANAAIQRADWSVGRRAGVLYLANTAGAVCGSLAAGFVLLPALGIQQSATVLTIIASLSIAPLFAVRPGLLRRSRIVTFVCASAICIAALVAWLRLPEDHVNARALDRPSKGERVIALSEGLTEIVEVTERPGEGRRLLTNGHPMSSTSRLAQRYMRALAHIPLLSIEKPESVLVIGFGVGNTTHAATLHPSVQRVELADLSQGVLRHATYFRDVNHDVLSNRRVVVYVNDGRQHLLMQPESSYDLITLEPPPVGYAGVAALYSSEFYALARDRLKEAGYVSQWLPAYQVPNKTTLAMIRAFIDVFPESVLLSGAESELLMIGTKGPSIEIDPSRLAGALSRAPDVEADLRRLDLGSVTEIVGTFVGSAKTLAEATKDSPAVTDDRPLQEYDVKSVLNLGEAVPASVVDLSQVSDWCPRCFVAGAPAPTVAGLDTYLALLNLAYRSSPADLLRLRALARPGERKIAGSAYLGSIVPESAELYNVLGLAQASKGAFDSAIAEFRRALQVDPSSAAAHWHLGAALATRGERAEAIAHLRRSVELDPTNEYAQNDLNALTGATERP